jgi:hypothetical protein
LEKLQTQRKQEVKDEFEKVLSGADKAGKFIQAGYVFDEDGNKIEGVYITPIEQTVNEKAFLMTGSQATSELSYYFGYDSSLMNHGIPGGKNLSGSGSEKMRSLQNRQILVASDREVTLDLMNTISDINGWDVEWEFKDVRSTTLDVSDDGFEEGEE